MMKLAEEYKAYSLIRPKTITATETGTGIDLSGSESDAMAILDLGAAATETSDTLNVVIQKCSDSSGTGAETIGTFTEVDGEDDNKLAAIAVDLSDGAKPFIRAVATAVDGGGGADSWAIAVSIIARQTVAKSGNNSATAA